MDILNEIQDDFLLNSCQGNKGIIWTDGDQKNFALTDEGKVMAFDFGRSIVCDPEFMPANLAGHLGLFVIADYLNIDLVKAMLEAFQKEMQKHDSNYVLPEKKVVNYFTASLLHRGMAMRWVDKRLADKIGEDSLKYASMHFGDRIFTEGKRVEILEEMFLILRKIAELAQGGNYRRKKLG